MFLLETVPGCTRTPLILFAFEELEVPYRIEARPAGFFEAQGRVGPLLVDTELDLRLYEPCAMLRHLGRRTGRLWPASLPEQARVDGWLDVFWSQLRPAVVRVKRGDQAERAVIAEALAILDQELAGRSFVLGDFGLADVLAVLVAMMAEHGLSPLIGAHPALREYAARVVARPAWSRALAAFRAIQAGAAASS